MKRLSRKEPVFLFFGDLLFFLVALWVTLVVRYGTLPSWVLFSDHLAPFSFLFLVWILVFFIAGLYEKRTILLRHRLISTLLQSELLNSAIAVAFFYFVPSFGIAPKTNLFIDLIFSFALILFWRLYGASLFESSAQENALLIGQGQEMADLVKEVNGNRQYRLRFAGLIDLDAPAPLDFAQIMRMISESEIGVVAIDLTHEKIQAIVPNLYTLIFSQVRFMEMHELYEAVFDRIPLSLVEHSWFLENISLAPKVAYGFLKRLMDFSISLVLGLISLVAYPFVWLGIKLDDGGPLFISQERIGRLNQKIRIFKFRTMSSNDNGNYGAAGAQANQVTRFGSFLRKTRIDELPQLWNVFLGDLSLIGPRPELPALAAIYEHEVPYYNIRHLITPGLSGWAQMYQIDHPHHGAAVDQTKEKLSYDLYYLKNRSFVLDVKIALLTLKTLLMRTGR